MRQAATLLTQAGLGGRRPRARLSPDGRRSLHRAGGHVPPGRHRPVRRSFDGRAHSSSAAAHWRRRVACWLRPKPTCCAWCRLPCGAFPSSLPPASAHRGAALASLAATAARRCPPAVTGDSPALATFTSGSTGAPKMAVRTHAFLRTQHDVIRETMRLRPDDVVLTTSAHLRAFASGRRRLHPDPGRGHPLSQVAWRPAPPGAPDRGAPRHLPGRVASVPGADRPLLPRRRAHAAGHHAGLYRRRRRSSPICWSRCSEVAPQAAIVAVYGSTEAEPMAEIDWAAVTQADLDAMLAGKGLLAGRAGVRYPVAHFARRLGRASSAHTPLRSSTHACLGPGLPGEIVVSGPHVLPAIGRDRATVRPSFVSPIRCGIAPATRVTWTRRGACGCWAAVPARIEDSRGTLYPFAVETAAAAAPPGETRRAGRA